MNRKTPHPIPRALAQIAGRMLGSLEHNPAARQLHALVNRLSSGAKALDNVNMARSPLDTDAAHALKVAKLAKQYDQQVLAAYTTAARDWGAGSEDLDRRINEKLNLKQNQYASEVRQRLAGMKDDARRAAIQAMIESGNGPAMAAVIQAESFLSGISDNEQKAYEISFTSKHAGDLVDEKAALEEVYVSSMAAAKAATSLVKEFTDPSNLAEIERGDAAARDAGAAFEQSLQQ